MERLMNEIKKIKLEDIVKPFESQKFIVIPAWQGVNCIWKIDKDVHFEFEIDIYFRDNDSVVICFDACFGYLCEELNALMEQIDDEIRRKITQSPKTRLLYLMNHIPIETEWIK